MLMQACLDEAAKQGCDTVWLDVWEPNVRARAFYRKWGFIEVGTQLFQLGSDLQHDLILQRSIHPLPPIAILYPSNNHLTRFAYTKGAGLNERACAFTINLQSNIIGG